MGFCCCVFLHSPNHTDGLQKHRMCRGVCASATALPSWGAVVTKTDRALLFFFFLWIFIQLFAQIKLNPHSSSSLMPSSISNGRSGLWRGPVEQPRSGPGCWLQPAQQSLLWQTSYPSCSLNGTLNLHHQQHREILLMQFLYEISP